MTTLHEKLQEEMDLWNQRVEVTRIKFADGRKTYTAATFLGGNDTRMRVFRMRWVRSGLRFRKKAVFDFPTAVAATRAAKAAWWKRHNESVVEKEKVYPL